MDLDKVLLQVVVNGQSGDYLVRANTLLIDFLREDCGLTSVKHSCGIGQCGACTVLVDNTPTLSCLTLALSTQGSELTTLEGLTVNGEMHPLQVAFVERGAIQCGYCSPGMILAAKALLDVNSSPTKEEIREFLGGNLCRCTGYAKIVEAVEFACACVSEQAELVGSNSSVPR